MSSYEALAACYDQFTADVSYPSWADYLEGCFRRAGVGTGTILDLACGTGSLTRELAMRGYEMIGVDQAPEMLAKAAEKCRKLGEHAPLFLCQSMDRLDLYGDIEACVCCLDSVNYVTKPQALRRAFQRVHLFLSPGGLFVFDVKPPEAMEAQDGQLFLDESESACCLWRAEFARGRGLLTYHMDIFLREGELWRRETETHRQRAYPLSELEEHLRAAGFVSVRRHGNLRAGPPRPGEERVFFTARKGKH